MLGSQMQGIRLGARVHTSSTTTERPGRRGEVVDVVTEPGHERCRVRWDDGTESIVYAGSDLVVEAAPSGEDSATT